uniref:Uncharacterized protein n=1 Tax=Chrysotila carterae TaxID=13221 RepID=A0A7S4BYD0_CHRCT
MISPCVHAQAGTLVRMLAYALALADSSSRVRKRRPGRNFITQHTEDALHCMRQTKRRPQLTDCINDVHTWYMFRNPALSWHRGDGVTGEFICGDAIELLKQPSSDREPPDVVFAYSTAFASNGVELTDFSLACAFLPVGSRVVTTDKLLVSEEDAGWRFDLLATLDGPNRETGGSTGYVWEVGRSLRNDAQVHS